jgi:hypothetical protein
VAEAAGHGADVDASSNQFRRGVVAQVVQVRFDPKPSRRLAVALADAVWHEELAVVWRKGEHERVSGQLRAHTGSLRLGRLLVVAKECHGPVIDCQPTLLVSLRATFYCCSARRWNR